MLAVEIIGVSRTYGTGSNRVHALRNVSLSIKEGEFVAIVGPSGSGKSTLMNLLGCLDNPTQGICRIFGKDSARLDADALSELRCRHLGFVFQRYNLLPHLSSLENVALPAVYAGADKEKRLARAQALLDDIGLGNRLGNLPAELSGGQQQRVSIARALMNGGNIVLADEPTGALDSASGANVMHILEEIHARGHTVIMVTHDPGVAAHADRVISISDGRIVSDQVSRQGAAGQASNAAAQAARQENSMDHLREAVKMSLQAVLSHKLRSCLTMLGIIIGIASVVFVVALGRGSQDKIIADINAMGTNTIDIFPGKGFGDPQADKITTLTVDDADVLGQQSYIASSTPNVAQSGTLLYRNIAVSAQLSGVGAAYFDVKGLQLSSGRLFTAADARANASVAVIDENVRQRLFPAEQAEGRLVLFNRQPLRVVGVVKKKDMGFGPSDTLQMWSPYTTVMYRITGSHSISSITVKVADAVLPLMAERNITRLLAARHKSKDFSTLNTESIRKSVESATGTMTMLITGIACIALLVGGIGVMNIMLVSVTERTREIGIRMAVGARRANIMEQFLVEAVLICMAGSVAGIFLAWVLSLAAGMFPLGFTLKISVWSILLAVACSSLIGICFGFVPARNASLLNPIDALSRE